MLNRLWLTLSLALLMAACVTINVYFPAAAVEKAADKIIEDIWGTGGVPQPETSPSPPLSRWLNIFIRPAHAQANINITTPKINQLQQSMSARFNQLKPMYDSGGVGLTSDGLITIRDAGALSLQQRAQAQRLVQQENADRQALYREIARANGHPEWEKDIQATFARRWIDNARSGWWYQKNGRWQQR